MLLFVVLLSACGSKVSAWQEQYDLGVRYLEEGNYEEAIIAFTAAIEIDPKRAPAYVGRGSAYLLSGDTEENLAAAQADFEKAIELDNTLAEAYIGLADVYIRLTDSEKALEVLKQGLAQTNESHDIADKITEVETISKENNISESDPFLQKSNYVSIDEFPADQADLLSQIIDTFTLNDIEAIVKLLYQVEGKIFPFLSQISELGWIYTTCDNYKIAICGSDRNSYMSDFMIELRPKDGTGYYCNIYPDTTEGTNCRYLMGECKDWNFNGDCLLTVGNYSNSKFTAGQETQSTAKDGLVDERDIWGKEFDDDSVLTPMMGVSPYEYFLEYWYW